MTTPNTLPTRLHHNAFVVKDQRATQRFYEGVLGFPLIATWTEVDELLGAERTYCHTFYGLADGSALAFFQFADPSDQALFEPQFRPSPFIHIALQVDAETQEALTGRLKEHDWEHLVIDHGYCVSLYATDPDGLQLEFTLDHADAERINVERRASAHADLDRWLGGDHSSNNPFREP
ncbi:VOC family protein [Actinocorallia sp. A-T 12471]|uniref:VOC family protein n=1 Tax=Actinocorallia sp. A-T 12471 TaxID=3089813 RepID=UPI0029CF3DA6|nr:VOC family protein [Actinocorallia sp. A-T 12471]MDX6739868.1 VOC family protein [Actinocorallia sp. A-T 12471]